jgi:hypothetical protein
MVPLSIDFDALSWESTAPGARFKAFRNGGKQIRNVEFTREIVEPHWFEKGHVGMVLKGELEIDFLGKLVRYPDGAGIHIPASPDNGHKARAVTPTVRLFLVEEASVKKGPSLVRCESLRGEAQASTQAQAGLGRNDRDRDERAAGADPRSNLVCGRLAHLVGEHHRAQAATRVGN